MHVCEFEQTVMKYTDPQETGHLQELLPSCPLLFITYLPDFEANELALFLTIKP